MILREVFFSTIDVVEPNQYYIIQRRKIKILTTTAATTTTTNKQTCMHTAMILGLHSLETLNYIEQCNNTCRPICWWDILVSASQNEAFAGIHSLQFINH